MQTEISEEKYKQDEEKKKISCKNLISTKLNLEQVERKIVLRQYLNKCAFLL